MPWWHHGRSGPAPAIPRQGRITGGSGIARPILLAGPGLLRCHVQRTHREPNRMNSGSSFRIQRAGLDELEPVASLFDAYRVFYGQPGNPVLARAFVRERMRCGESVIFLACRPDAAAIGFTQLYPSFSSISASRAFILNDLFVVP